MIKTYWYNSFVPIRSDRRGFRQHVSNRSNTAASKNAPAFGGVTPALKKCGVALLKDIFSRFGGWKRPERKSRSRSSAWCVRRQNHVISICVRRRHPLLLKVFGGRKDKKKMLSRMCIDLGKRPVVDVPVARAVSLCPRIVSWPRLAIESATSSLLMNFDSPSSSFSRSSTSACGRGHHPRSSWRSSSKSSNHYPIRFEQRRRMMMMMMCASSSSKTRSFFFCETKKTRCSK